MALLRGRCLLPELLLRAQITPAELARRMKVSESAVSRWIKGTRDMTYENTVLAARVLDCHAEDIYEFTLVKESDDEG